MNEKQITSLVKFAKAVSEKYGVAFSILRIAHGEDLLPTLAFHDDEKNLVCLAWLSGDGVWKKVTDQQVMTNMWVSLNEFRKSHKVEFVSVTVTV